MELTGRSVLVTGANRGIGRQFVTALLERGARVYAGARTVGEVEARPGVTPLRLDVTSPADIAAAADAAADVSVLVNNAGIALPRPFTEPNATESALRELEVNLLGTWRMTSAFAPVLARHDTSAIVNVLSAASWIGLPTAPGYAASKAAQWSLTNSTRLALRSQNTAVLAVHCGYVDTDFSRAVAHPKIEAWTVAAAALDGLALDREEVVVDGFSHDAKAAALGS